jgi:hypothetical protein
MITIQRCIRQYLTPSIAKKSGGNTLLLPPVVGKTTWRLARKSYILDAQQRKNGHLSFAAAVVVILALRKAGN